MRAGIKTRIFERLALAAVVLALASCASHGPSTRIQNNPAMYEGLGAEDRAMVAEGRIREGMHKDGVFLAWGRPDRVTAGSEAGRRLDTWGYLSMRSVWRRGVGVGMGYGSGWGGHWGRHGAYRSPGWHGGGFYEPWVDHVAVETARVRFLDDEVVAWEMLR
jgi:hypothetical protein